MEERAEEGRKEKAESREEGDEVHQDEFVVQQVCLLTNCDSVTLTDEDFWTGFISLKFNLVPVAVSQSPKTTSCPSRTVPICLPSALHPFSLVVHFHLFLVTLCPAAAAAVSPPPPSLSSSFSLCRRGCLVTSCSHPPPPLSHTHTHTQPLLRLLRRSCCT